MLSQFEDPAILRTLQRSFVKQLLTTQEEWLPPAATEVIEKGKEFDWYVHASPGLQWNIKNAWIEPLKEDADAISWLRHSSEPIAAAALKAIGKSEVYTIIESFLAKKDYEQAAGLLSGVANNCDGLGISEQLECCKRCWAAVDCIAWDGRSDALHKMDIELSWWVNVGLATQGDANWMISVSARSTCLTLICCPL
jgi:hypothetical protein